MLKGTTATGFSFSIDEDIMDDMELLENLTLLDKGELDALPKVMMQLLGEKQKKKLYDFCRNKKGRVPATKVMEEIKEIFEVLKKQDSKTKN